MIETIAVQQVAIIEKCEIKQEREEEAKEEMEGAEKEEK